MSSKLPLGSILRPNICRLFHIFLQFPFITSEKELDFYQQKLNRHVSSQIVLENCKNLDVKHSLEKSV